MIQLNTFRKNQIKVNKLSRGVIVCAPFKNFFKEKTIRQRSERSERSW